MDGVENPVVVLLLLYGNDDLLDIVDSALMDLETLDDLLVVPAVQLECGPTPELGFLNQRIPGPDRK